MEYSCFLANVKVLVWQKGGDGVKLSFIGYLLYFETTCSYAKHCIYHFVFILFNFYHFKRSSTKEEAKMPNPKQLCGYGIHEGELSYLLCLSMGVMCVWGCRCSGDPTSRRSEPKKKKKNLLMLSCSVRLEETSIIINCLKF